MEFFPIPLKKVHQGIIFMQETRSTESDLISWKSEWQGALILNHGTRNSQGTLIAFTTNLNCKIINKYFDSEGRFQLVTIEYENQKILLVSIYNENVESKQVILLKNLNEKLSNILDIWDYEILIGGDWNFILNKKLDADGGSPSLKLSSIAELV